MVMTVTSISFAFLLCLSHRFFFFLSLFSFLLVTLSPSLHVFFSFSSWFRGQRDEEEEGGEGDAVRFLFFIFFMLFFLPLNYFLPRIFFALFCFTFFLGWSRRGRGGERGETVHAFLIPVFVSSPSLPFMFAPFNSYCIFTSTTLPIYVCLYVCLSFYLLNYLSIYSFNSIIRSFLFILLFLL